MGFNRSSILKNFSIPYKLLKGIYQARKLLKKIRPDVVFSKGGYVSMPTVIAARILKIPVVALESDLSLGLANKMAFKLNAIVLTSFEKPSLQNNKLIYVGFPLRHMIFQGDAE